MKNLIKHILLLTVFSIFSFNAFAQRSAIGLKSGVNFADITDNKNSTDIRLAYHFGGFAKIYVNNKLAVQPEFLYSLQGSKLQANSFLGGSEENNLNLHYITVPLMLKYYPIEGFNLQFGPQFAYLVDAKYNDNNIDNVYNNTDWSLNVGAGFDINGVQIGARYNIGLTNIYTGEQDNINENRVVQVYIGFEL